MSNKIFKKYSYDIAFNEEVGNHLVSWVTGLMVFFVTLTLAVNIALSSVTATWVDELSGSVTVELKPPIKSSKSAAVFINSQKKFKQKVENIMTMLRNREDIEEAHLLTDSDIRDLIMPWIGSNISLDTIPLPTLIDVKTTDNTNLTQLTLELTKIDPTASIDTHKATITDIDKMINTTSIFVMLLSLIISALAVISISGIVRSKLLIHKTEVETLHLMGATNEHIASQFRHHTLNRTLTGSIAGTIFTIITLISVAAITNTLNADVFAYIKIMPFEWILIIISPVVVGVAIAHLTAQATALREISKLP